MDNVQIFMNTEQRIVDKALEMFNERGVEYVGLRELAGVLQMRVSNITYYFPTKDDLVNRLSIDLGELNSRTILEDNNLTMHSFLQMLKQVFYNHLKYRCLLLSFVHIMEQNKVVSERYKHTQSNRNATLQANLHTLIRSGYLSVKEEKEVEFLVSTLALIVRFWLSEAAVSYRHLSTGEQIEHYLNIIAKILLPYATESGRLELEAFQETRT